MSSQAYNTVIVTVTIGECDYRNSSFVIPYAEIRRLLTITVTCILNNNRNIWKDRTIVCWDRLEVITSPTRFGCIFNHCNHQVNL